MTSRKVKERGSRANYWIGAIVGGILALLCVALTRQSDPTTTASGNAPGQLYAKNILVNAVRTANSDGVQKILGTVCGDGEVCLQKLIREKKRGSQLSLLHMVLHHQHRLLSQEYASPDELRPTQRTTQEKIASYDTMFNSFIPYASLERCAVIDAIHFRLWNFVRTFLDIMPRAAIQRCFQDQDVYGDNVLHVVSKSKAAGFARYFLRRAMHEGQKDTADIDERLRLSPPRTFRPPFTFRELDDACGHGDLIDLLNHGQAHGLGATWVNAQNTDGETPIHITCRVGRAAATRVLLQHGADVSFRGNVWNESCIHVAAARGHIEVLEAVGEVLSSAVLLPLLDARDAFDRTPLDVACTTPYAQVIAWLLRRVDPEKAQEEVLQCKMAALERNYTAVLVALTSLGVVPEEMVMANVAMKTPKMTFTTPASLPKQKNSLNKGWYRSSMATSVYDTLREETPKVAIEWGENLTRGTFIKEYVSRNVPVLIKGLGKTWPAMQKWTKKNFLGRYGSHRITASVIPYGNTYGKHSFQTNLRDYVKKYAGKDYLAVIEGRRNKSAISESNLPTYVFDAGYLMEKVFQGDVPTPQFLHSLSRRTVLKQFALGPRGTGAQPHFHGKVWNALVHGRKRWHLQAPPDGHFSGKSALAFFTSLSTQKSNRSGSFEVIQEQGDILYVPEHWSHATLVLEDSLATAIEFE